MSYFETHELTPAERQMLIAFSRRPWTARFHATLPNESAPGGAVDMYMLLDEDVGEQCVSIAVPVGQGHVANWIAACCARPWLIDPKPEGETMTKIAVAFNRALKTFVDNDGQLDGRDVALAAMTILTSYVSDLPKHARDEISNRLLVGLNEMMRMD